jgi:hypothetical protein
MSEVLNDFITQGIPYIAMLESLSALVAMALSITNPLTDDKARLKKFEDLLRQSLSAQAAIEGKDMKQIILPN